MARLTRIKFNHPEDGYYHVISRTVQQEFLLRRDEKEYFLKLLKKLSRVYFVRVVTMAIMSNHFHLICQMMPHERISDEELQRRFDALYNEGRPKSRWREFLDDVERETFRKRCADLSRFLQDLKQRFSRWYNRKHQRHGHVWSERFKSVLLQGDRALLACMVYVELNAVRAGIVDKPEDYRYCGLHHNIAGGRVSKWLDTASLETALSSQLPPSQQTSPSHIMKAYLRLIYRKGIMPKEGKAQIDDGSQDSGEMRYLSFMKRIRYFTDGVILGSKEFCDEKFIEFRDFFQTKGEKAGKPISPPKLKDMKLPKQEDDLLDLHSIRSFSRHHSDES